MIEVYFVYGLAFFVLGVALMLAGRQESELRFASAIRPLAGFGITHGIHEWIEMFERIRLATGAGPLGPLVEGIRVGLLVASFLMLLIFGLRMVAQPRIRYLPLLLGGLWFLLSLWRSVTHGGLTVPALYEIDVLARYVLAIPAALIGAWGLMVQQREFRAAKVGEYGGLLITCSISLLLYGAVGQAFVRGTALPPSHIVNADLFLSWFGLPVQLFRTVLALSLTACMLNVLRAIEVENARRLSTAQATRTAAQEHALAVERRARAQEGRLNRELQQQARELALSLELSNQLLTPEPLAARLDQALRQIVQNFDFADAGMVLLVGKPNMKPIIAAVTGFATHQLDDDPEPRFVEAFNLGTLCLERNRAVCHHENGSDVEFDLDAVVVGQECWRFGSPTTTIALPLTGQGGTTGTIVLARIQEHRNPLSLSDLRLLAAVARQMGFSTENARLYQDAQAREQLLGNLLHQVVRAQESERQRIARDLHDATAQSITAIALGLRGVENAADDQDSPILAQLSTLRGFANEALVELRRIMADLRPPQLDDLGLGAALNWYIQTFRRRYPAITLRYDAPAQWPPFVPEVETLLFRVVQEALTNVTKHARAEHASVQVVTNASALTIIVEDDGIGFEPQDALEDVGGGWGLLGMRERMQLVGGAVELVSKLGIGTTVLIQVPLSVSTQGRTMRSTATGTPVDSPTAPREASPREA